VRGWCFAHSQCCADHSKVIRFKVKNRKHGSRRCGQHRHDWTTILKGMQTARPGESVSGYSRDEEMNRAAFDQVVTDISLLRAEMTFLTSVRRFPAKLFRGVAKQISTPFWMDFESFVTLENEDGVEPFEPYDYGDADLAAEVSDSKDVPPTDNFSHTAVTHAIDADASDFCSHQFIVSQGT